MIIINGVDYVAFHNEDAFKNIVYNKKNNTACAYFKDGGKAKYDNVLAVERQ